MCMWLSIEMETVARREEKSANLQDYLRINKSIVLIIGKEVYGR